MHPVVYTGSVYVGEASELPGPREEVFSKDPPFSKACV